MQADLFVDHDREEDSVNLKVSLGKNFVLQFSDPEKSHCTLLHQGKPIKVVNLKDKVAKKMLVIEAVELNVIQTRLACALGISRQTIHNYRETHKYFGLEGLVHGYNPEVSKNLAEQRRIHAQERAQGNKSKQVAEFRAREREAEQAERARVQARLNFSYGEKGRIREVPAEQQPFAQNHEWEATRYAGLFVYWISLIGQWNWLDLVMGHFGKAWRIFAVFLLMSGRNLRSLEQLKHVRKREAGRLLGLGKLPAHTTLAQWFHEAARMGIARTLLDDYFRHQIRTGLVAGWLWFCDGHLLPYTGKAKVHYSYHTQRRMPVPGRTSQVICDQSGRIVDFVIEEGKGEMKARILETVEKWRSELPTRPIQVFDREGYDRQYFSKLVKAGQPFVTWDKNVDHKQLKAIPDEQFTTEFVFNGKRYRVLEGEKTFPHAELEEGLESHFTLRHLILWNQTRQRRTAGLVYDGGGELSTEDAAQAILSRWGPRRIPSSISRIVTPSTTTPASAWSRASARKSPTHSSRRKRPC